MDDDTDVKGSVNPLDLVTRARILEKPWVTAEAGKADPPSSRDTLARFEFENGKANEGTKVLMVEWRAVPSDASSPQTQGGWEVDFQGKTASFPLGDEDDNGTLRVYFLIAPQVPIPSTVTISQAQTGQLMTTKSMPAIFAPALGVDAKDAGKRGVLHTAWAKKRLSQLQEEIRVELRNNSEGIGLEMAMQERQWIVDHFGLEDPQASERPPPPPLTPQSPRSPIGGRLGEKLKGLKLATSPADLAGNPGTDTKNPLQSMVPEPSGTAAPFPSSPPRSIHLPKAGSGTVLASLHDVIGNEKPRVTPGSRSTENELFALPMSPRSPEVKTSPFSILKSG
ncbi:hypothetical protein DL764_002130 [Monosporascus ibericus]|uniref:Uncharacterized protein n=1 Tax=Monosporascus ibericus TaxID=155417 RepID=A0A4Q4TRI5_9PEZI|nr:hypothetical protein DL764_002130 [Monosporascus ibericus]